MIEVVHNPLMQVFEVIVFAAGLTAIPFIAIILYLDLQRETEPVALPSKR
jgi:hypothetical protein